MTKLNNQIFSYGFIGLGDMGNPIATNLLKSNKELYVYDISDLKSKSPKGAIKSKSILLLSKKVQVIFISVPDGEASYKVIKEIVNNNNNKLKAIINLSTVGVKDTKQITDMLSNTDVEYIDAPVSGGKTGAINGSITVMWSGSKKIYNIVKNDISYFARSIFYMGDVPGQGQVMKLMNNFLSAVAITSTSEAIKLGLKCDLDMKTMLEVLNVSTGLNSATLDKFPNRILTKTYDAGFKMSLMNKDVGLYINEARNNNVSTNIAEVVNNYFQKGQKSIPSGDFTEIFKIVSKT